MSQLHQLTLKMGDIVLCQESKDIVKITNGIEKDGVFTPTECMCLRVTGYSKTKRGLYPVMGFSYRAFPSGQVSVLKDCTLFDFHDIERKYFGGRF